MGLMGFGVGFINTAACGEGCENGLVGSLVYRQVALAAFQVASGFLVGMFACSSAATGCCFWMCRISAMVLALVVFLPTARVAGRVLLR